MRNTSAVLARLESLIAQAGFSVRYEKGSFAGGHCIVQTKKTVVVNKFYPLEGRISTLLQVALQISWHQVALQPEDYRWLQAQLTPTNVMNG